MKELERFGEIRRTEAAMQFSRQAKRREKELFRASSTY